MQTELLIIGGGPAGMTAALYAARAGKQVTVLEKETPGGQIVYAPMVENFPGTPHMSGAEFSERMQTQCEQTGVAFAFGEALALQKNENLFTVVTETEPFSSKAVIAAVGAQHRHLGLPGEEALTGSGLSYCAVCDGPFYTGGKTAVIGGGDTALEEALFLSDICASVTLIHRRSQFRAQETLVRRIQEKKNIILCMDSVTEELLESDGLLTGIRLKNNVNGEESLLPLDGLFIAVGQIPATEWLKTFSILDENGYILAGEDCKTDIPGLFAAGDCRKKGLRQLTTAAADGAVAAMHAIRLL